MALNTGIYPDSATGASYTTRSELAPFIPELWSDEIIAAYKSNLVMAPLCVMLNHSGKKGDTIHIPTPDRQSATAKATRKGVTIIGNDESNKSWVINQHFEYTRLIEDIASIQAIDTYRSFYTDDAGYALAIEVDSAIHAEASGFQDPDAYQISTTDIDSRTEYEFAVNGDGTTTWAPAADGNAAALTDIGLRAAIQTLDDDDVPSARRVLVVNPAQKNTLLGASVFERFNRYDGTAASGTSQSRTGLIGELYGIPVYVSTSCRHVPDANDATGADQVANLLFQKEALAHIEQLNPRTQTDYKLEYLADMFTADTIFDAGLLRPEGGVALVVPA
jgi:hypothetical protein